MCTLIKIIEYYYQTHKAHNINNSKWSQIKALFLVLNKKLLSKSLVLLASFSQWIQGFMTPPSPPLYVVIYWICLVLYFHIHRLKDNQEGFAESHAAPLKQNQFYCLEDQLLISLKKKTLVVWITKAYLESTIWIFTIKVNWCTLLIVISLSSSPVSLKPVQFCNDSISFITMDLWIG